MVKYKDLLPTYVKGLYNGKYTLRQASEATGYSIRQLSSLKQKYKKDGDLIFQHKNKGRAPKNRIDEVTKTKIALLYASDLYKDVNFRYFRKCLEDFEGIKISLTTLRKIMDEFGFRSPECHKVKYKQPKVHRTRFRRENEGDLLQIDGTPFPWFYKSTNDKANYCMHGAIDDATGKITALYITENECLYGYMEMLRRTLTKYGVPREIYSDRAAIFCYTPRKNQHGDAPTVAEQLEGIHQKRTQWQRILEELQIRQILAWSPQAKGRAERMWQTLQGRIPTLFAIKNIKTVDQANEFLLKYVDEFNAEFAVSPAKPDTFYLPAPENLDGILQARFPRKTNTNGILSFHNYKLAVMGARRSSNISCQICVSEHGITALMPDGLYYPVKIVENPDGDYEGSVGTDMSEALVRIIYDNLFKYAKEVSI